MDKKMIEQNKLLFDGILHEEDGVEFWYARDLMVLLEYTEWRNFLRTIEKAIVSCEVNGIDAKNHFVEVNKMVKLGSGTSFGERAEEISERENIAPRKIKECRRSLPK